MRYLFRKMKKSLEQYPFKNQILHNFHFIFFSTIDIKFFKRGRGRGQVELFFDILLYYFVNVTIKTLYISSFMFFLLI